MAVLLGHDNPADAVHACRRDLDVRSGYLISGVYVELLGAAAFNRIAVVDGKDRSRRGGDDVCAVGQTGYAELAAVVSLRKSGKACLLRACCGRRSSGVRG